jgi:hypothetical protein
MISARGLVQPHAERETERSVSFESLERLQPAQGDHDGPDQDHHPESGGGAPRQRVGGDAAADARGVRDAQDVQ